MGLSSLHMPTGYFSPVYFAAIFSFWLAACLGTVESSAEPLPEPFALTRIDFEVVLDGKPEELRSNADVREFYLGLDHVGTQKSYRDVKHYRRRKRWLS